LAAPAAVKLLASGNNFCLEGAISRGRLEP
jgi:hypothetical protein